MAPRRSSPAPATRISTSSWPAPATARGSQRLPGRIHVPGVSTGAPLAKMGLHGSWTAELVFDGVRVPVTNRLGDEGVGFTVAMSALDSGRVGISAQAVGIAQGALDAAVGASRRHRDAGWRSTRRRSRTWRRVPPRRGSHATRCRARRRGTARHARGVDCKALLDRHVRRRCAGGRRSVRPGSAADEHPAAMRFRDAKGCQIYEGTNQIQRVVIARHVFRG